MNKIGICRGKKVLADLKEAVLLEVYGELIGRLQATIEIIPNVMRAQIR